MAFKMKSRPKPAVFQDPREEFAELRERLRIDRNTLDDDMLAQPVLFHEVSEAHVMACSQRDSAKEHVASVSARLANAIRRKWIAEGEKFAEARVGDAVQLEPEYQEAHMKLSAMEARASYLGALKGSYDQRSRMLRELGGLFVAGYFDRVVSRAGKKDADSGRAAMGREGMRQARMRREGE